MLISAKDLLQKSILSVHMADVIATPTDFIIDPTKLSIVAFFIDAPDFSENTILRTSDIREYSSLGMIIDSEDDFADAEDIIVVKKLLDLNFQLTGLKVYTKSGQYLGRVDDFFIDTDDFKIYRFTVKRPAFKALFDPEFFIARSQILEVDNQKIIVADSAESASIKESLPQSFVNPFRQSSLVSNPGQIPDVTDTLSTSSSDN